MAKKKEQEYIPAYTIEQLVEAAGSAFGAHAVVVKAALAVGGKTEYTIEEAGKLIKYFTDREV